jgi:SMP-30/gluconolaconase/LRE-like protein
MTRLPTPNRIQSPPVWQRLRTLLVVVAFTLAVAAASGPPAGATAPAAASCKPWSTKTIATTTGIIENLEFDRRGGLLFSLDHPTDSSIKRLDRKGRITTLIPSVLGPGGQRMRGSVLYFNTGDLPWSGSAGLKDGTIDTFDLRTGNRRTWARNLVMPNGLVFLPNGDAVVSRDLNGPDGPTGITRIRRSDPAHPQYNWVATDDSNGMAVDPTGRWLYFVQTGKEGSPLWRAKIANPRVSELFASLGSGSGLDDMTIDSDGVLYVTRNAYAGAGEVIRFDPRTKRSCVIARGLSNPSSVKFGCAPGWPSTRLYVVAFDGTIRELSRPFDASPSHGQC